MPKNLNKADPVQNGFIHIEDYSIENQVASVSVYFREIKEKLISEIKKADAIFGCVAWINDPILIDALMTTENVSIVINDGDSTNLTPLANLVSKKNSIALEQLAHSSNHFHTFINEPDFAEMSQENPKPEDKLHTIREVKSANVAAPSDGFSGYEKMHNKFLIFAKSETDLVLKSQISSFYYAQGTSSPELEALVKKAYRPKLKPYAVWTGSYNLTNNANNSLENATLIYSDKVSEQYFKEFAQIYLLSSPI